MILARRMLFASLVALFDRCSKRKCRRPRETIRAFQRCRQRQPSKVAHWCRQPTSKRLRCTGHTAVSRAAAGSFPQQQQRIGPTSAGSCSTRIPSTAAAIYAASTGRSTTTISTAADWAARELSNNSRGISSRVAFRSSFSSGQTH